MQKKVAETYQKIGVSYIAVPYLPEEYRPNTPGYETVLKEMARIGQIMKEYGIKLEYHNHDLSLSGCRMEPLDLMIFTAGFRRIY